MVKYKAESIINLIQRICVAKIIFEAKLLLNTKCLSGTIIGEFFWLRFNISMCVKYMTYLVNRTGGQATKDVHT